MWKITEENDVGEYDGYYNVWFEITNGSVTFTSDSKSDAEKLRDLLNSLKEDFLPKEEAQ